MLRGAIVNENHLGNDAKPAAQEREPAPERIRPISGPRSRLKIKETSSESRRFYK